MSSWREAPAPIPAEQISRVEQAEVVIVGLGHAGTAAFRAAAEAGADVIAIEKMKEEAFNVYGCDIGHYNSRFLVSRGVPKVDPVDLFNEMMRRSNNKANPGLMMNFAQNIGETFDWYTDSFSKEEMDEVRVTYFPTGKHYSSEIGGYHYWPGTAEFPGIWYKGELTLTRLTRRNIELGCAAGGRTFFGMDAQQLIKEDGRVAGVIAADNNGNYILYHASKAVILAAGDFGGNPEMRAELCADIVDMLAPGEEISGPGRSGRGIQMGIWAGGRLEAGTLPAMGGNDGLAPSLTDRSAVLILDKEGKRFCNESLGDPVFVGQSFAQRMRGMTYQIFDSDVLEDLERIPPSHGSFDINNKERLDRLFALMEEAVKNGPKGAELHERAIQAKLYAGNTVEELVDNAGFTGEVRDRMIRSIKEYQEICRNGYDYQFGKDPKMLRPMDHAPFFMQFVERNVMGFVMVTVGGLVTDERQRVLDQSYEVLPGLYATGNCCGLRFGPQYSTPTPGISIAMALTLGRLAGKDAAK